MDTLFFVTGALLLVLLLTIFYLRVAGLHTRKMNEEQARLNKKTGAHSPTNNPPTSVSIATRMTGFIKGSNLVVFLFGIAGVGFLWWLYQSDLTITVVAAWVWNHLLFSLVLVGIVARLLSRSFRTVWASWMPPVVLACLLMAHWVNSSSLQTVAISHCQDASRFETRECVLDSGVSSPIKFADGPSDNGMNLCISPGIQFERTQNGETTYWRLRGPKGVTVRYRVARDCSSLDF